ncbi:glycoside hydrolase family 3 protein [Lactococcus cremoris]|uniref:glycoside hydrolase family 3 protein n=1 Tax=Lactococcus lactis subsp. cremoris TaxID=1359 RepID=UPI00287182BE|nr:glycoside hydrolase family 3 protein [Lactococcus cremoris]MDR9866882.1 glycoside hydrolase family 3 protein [Lactococcus cremoris]
MTKRLKKQAKPVVFLGLVIGCALIVSGVLGLSGHLNNQEAIKSKKKNQVSETKTNSSSQNRSDQKMPKMTLEQKVGQLFMTGMPANNYDQATFDAIEKYQVGSIILTGRSNLSIPEMKVITDKLQGLAPANRRLLISCDQEGGNVQVLQGAGFSEMPNGLTQGSWAPEKLQEEAKNWGSELSAAGINFDLAPVADQVLSADFASQNAPIGYWSRQYAYDKANIVSHADAFSKGMKSAGVLTTAKHFPGLGSVTGNTDISAGVRDSQTNPKSESVQIFKELISSGVPSIMTATAFYDQIDPELPGAFSPKMVDGLLRNQLGFDGLIITDDLSNAVQVQAWSPGQRAVLALAAGNDLVLANEPTQIPEMISEVLQKAKSDQEFAEKINQASSRVMKVKEQMKLVE